MSNHDSNEQKGIDGQLLRRIITYLLPYKGWVTLAFVFVMTAAFLGPLKPKLVQITIDRDILTGDLEGIREEPLRTAAALRPDRRGILQPPTWFSEGAWRRGYVSCFRQRPVPDRVNSDSSDPRAQGRG